MDRSPLSGTEGTSALTACMLHAHLSTPRRQPPTRDHHRLIRFSLLATDVLRVLIDQWRR
jgi:hypothetical protein